MKDSTFITLNFMVSTISLLAFTAGLAYFIIKFKGMLSLLEKVFLILFLLDFILAFLNIGIV